LQNYPNPFNSETNLSFTLHKSSFVNLSVFDINGNLISTIIKYSKKELPRENELKHLKNLLPDIKTLQWLSYIHSLNTILNSEYLRYPYMYEVSEKNFFITSDKEHYIIQNGLQKLEKPPHFPVELFLNGIRQ
jgi:hypothetical protein